jgi:hypothetical protein
VTVCVPLAVNDAAGTLEDNAVTIAVLANDLDPAGGGLTVTSITQPDFGSAAIDVGNQTVTFTPAPGLAGVFTFTYVATDINSRSDSASVSVIVSARSETGYAPEVAPVNPTITPKDIFYLVYTELITPTGDVSQPPSGLKFGNFVFDLSAWLNDRLLSPITFAQPVTLTIPYNPALLNGLNESTLVVYYWNGTAWANDGITLLARDPVNHQLTIAITHLTEFAFFAAAPTGIVERPEPEERAWKIYLPAIGREGMGRDSAAPVATPAEVPVLPAGSKPLYLPLIGQQ